MPFFRLIFRFLPLILLATLLAGCATPVTVTSSPEGAAVYCRGSGRPAYRWKFRGNTPVTFKVPYNAIQTFVQWPGASGRRSEVRQDKLLFEDEAKLHFVQTE
ncbi:MAG: hypothetical protein GX571_02920 [Lentisphaerae bacterium]|jgi:hypothetical protein|nr:hypothetical protein [Lentisphaerota bacterium]